jgi:hypothetical protein
MKQQGWKMLPACFGGVKAKVHQRMQSLSHNFFSAGMAETNAPNTLVIMRTNRWLPIISFSVVNLCWSNKYSTPLDVPYWIPLVCRWSFLFFIMHFQARIFIKVLISPVSFCLLSSRY